MAGKTDGNYFLKLVKARKSTYEFNDKKLNASYVKKILEAGQLAQSN